MPRRTPALVLCLALALLAACGGITRRVLVEAPRDSYDSLFAGLIEVAAERGLEARPRRGGISIVVDRSSGARITYAPRRNGLYMSVGVRTDDEAEEAELGLAEAELSRLENLGQELIAAARERARRIDGERAAREIQELEIAARRREEEEARRAEEAAWRAANPPALTLTGPTLTDPTGVAPSGGGGTTGGAQCCINGSYYECPDGAAVDRCAGAFTRCLMACDFACTDECLASTPPDPSGCTRRPERDGEC